MKRILESDHLSEIERAVARIVARQPGIKNAALGAAVGTNETNACRIKRRPAVQAAIARLGLDSKDDLRDRVRVAGGVGLETLILLAQESQDETIRLKAASALVDGWLKQERTAAAPAPAVAIDEVTIRRRVSLALGLGQSPIERIEEDGAGEQPGPGLVV